MSYIASIENIDSPALLVYADKVKENIAKAVRMIGDVNRLRPHVKTSKIAEVNQLLLDAGVTKFKCATIAEAEMLGIIDAPDVLLAYQPFGPKIDRFIAVMNAYPATRFSCLVDNEKSATDLSAKAIENGIVIPVFIDLNVGMNRTGIKPEHATALALSIKEMKGIQLAGLHAYDGHINDKEVPVRQQRADAVYDAVTQVYATIAPAFDHALIKVVGGSPTFPLHLLRADVECSPGTFVFWDWNYKHGLPDEPFDYAALVLTRVVSIIDATTICTDLGHKSVAAENPLPRVHFLNAPEVTPVGQSEEHLVLRVPDSSKYAIGDAFYGVPLHICPTVALYERAHVIEDGKKVGEWRVIARDRSINY